MPVAVKEERDLARELREDPTKIEVGMGASLHIMSDSYSYTIIEVARGGKLLTVQRDETRRDAVTGEQVIVRDHRGKVEKYSLRKNGRYSQVGHEMAWYMSLTPGIRVEYRDMSR
ncbi:hypothetical protein SEA_A3WALLY_363 [Microbacterium phage A3Wally]|nr:hypothetical protein SEA_A3WALLY_9 [Microbacterium phage A3Wally]QWY84170.1 hypothetical protein SEA_A3WALLY_363 [Microbacterium phage A3Wally]